MLLIVVVNFRTPGLVVDCLRSVAASRHEVPAGVKLVVVENGSGDDSATQIRSAIDANGWGDWASVRAEATNWGFAGGNNRGLELLQSDPAIRYALLLNSDTVVHEGCLGHCYRLMEAEPRIGVLSCALRNPDGSSQNTCRKFPNPGLMTVYALGLPWKSKKLFGWADFEDLTWDRTATRRDVDWVGGAFMFCLADAIRTLGGLDEAFFFYGEDIEFCHRFAKAGYRIHFDPAVSITHLGGASTDPAKLKGRALNVNFWQARYTLQRQCWGRAAAALVRGADVAAYGSRLAAMALLGRRSTPEYALKKNVLSLLLHRMPAGATAAPPKAAAVVSPAAPMSSTAGARA